VRVRGRGRGRGRERGRVRVRGRGRVTGGFRGGRSHAAPACLGSS